jgi:hypothetical protein
MHYAKRAPVDDLPRLVGATEVKRIYNISETTLKRYVDDGFIPKPLTFGRLRRWNLAELPHVGHAA